MDIIEQTWKDMGFKLRGFGYQTWVRCDRHHRKAPSGLLWLPPKAQGFLGVLPHMVTIEATVIASGPVGVAKQFKPGDRVMFKRLHFGTWCKLAQTDRESQFGETHIGFIDANQILGFAPDHAREETKAA